MLFFSLSRPLPPPILSCHNFADRICTCNSISLSKHSFKFTKLDRNNPSRPFTFLLSTDENDQYLLSKVNPHINQTRTDAILEELNNDGTNGLNKFAIGMSEYQVYIDFSSGHMLTIGSLTLVNTSQSLYKITNNRKTF